jgi:hypothetical protein
MQHDTSPLRGVDQAVDCGLWELEHAVVHIDPEHPKQAQCLVRMQAMEELGDVQLPGIV